MIDDRGVEIVVEHAQLTLALDEVMVFGIDEDAADETAQVVVTLIEEGVGKEVVDVDDSAVGAVGVFADVG